MSYNHDYYRETRDDRLFFKHRGYYLTPCHGTKPGKIMFTPLLVEGFIMEDLERVGFEHVEEWIAHLTSDAVRNPEPPIWSFVWVQYYGYRFDELDKALGGTIEKYRGTELESYVEECAHQHFLACYQYQRVTETRIVEHIPGIHLPLEVGQFRGGPLGPDEPCLIIGMGGEITKLAESLLNTDEAEQS
ncbi:MAG: hypothetical protein WCJ64_05880 [Rhodospirillaceae bacterium]